MKVIKTISTFYFILFHANTPNVAQRNDFYTLPGKRH